VEWHLFCRDCFDSLDGFESQFVLGGFAAEEIVQVEFGRGRAPAGGAVAGAAPEFVPRLKVLLARLHLSPPQVLTQSNLHQVRLY